MFDSTRNQLNRYLRTSSFRLIVSLSILFGIAILSLMFWGQMTLESSADYHLSQYYTPEEAFARDNSQARSDAGVPDEISSIRRVFSVAYPLFFGGLFLTTVALLFTSFQQFRQTDTIYQTIDGFVRGDLTRRIPNFNNGSELNKLGQRFNGILARSEYLMTNSRQIVNNISHDLRKPLTRIKNRLELLQFETSDDYQIDELERSVHDADNLLKTFNDLLSISQAESGLHRDAFERISLRAICEDMIEMYEPIAEERGVNIRSILDKPFMIIGNRQLITQLISNLIDNACKYAASDNGQLIIFGENTTHYTTLRFADNGPGVPAKLREKVLERFVRLDAARSTEGNGLGLSLAQAVMALHQGELVLGETQKDENRPGLMVKLVFPRADFGNLGKAPKTQRQQG